MPARTSIRSVRARGLRAVLAAAVVAAVPLATSAAASAAATTHVVRPGETLVGIAASHGTTVGALASANGIVNPNRITAGQVLKLPASVAPAPAVHRVAAGETLFDIARRYGITTAALAAANSITNPDLLRIGQQLAIPTGSDTTGGDDDGDDGDATTHTVRAGETLASIADRYDVTARAIAEANELTNPNVIRIGQRLTIPAAPAGDDGDGGGTSAYAATGGADGHTGVFGTHTVEWGESLDDIADQYGVSVEDLAAANGLLPPYNLYAGANLYLSAPNRLPTNLAVCPVASARFANDWRFPRPVGRFHAGNDMLAPSGTPVRAPVDGEVTYLTGPRGGLQFELWGEDDTRYIGTHLDESGATGRVEAGDVIGYVGTSGNEVAEPHLHFEVHPDDGAAMNPYPVLRAACR